MKFKKWLQIQEGKPLINKKNKFDRLDKIAKAKRVKGGPEWAPQSRVYT